MGNVDVQWDNGRSHTDAVARELLDWSAEQGREIYWMWVLGPTGHHAAGRGIDFMTLTANQGALRSSVGDHLAAYIRKHHRRLGIQYLIWKQRIWNATRSDDNPHRVRWSSWRTMEDRGSTTANHYDHVHVSLRDDPPAYRPPVENHIAPEKDWFDMATPDDLKQVVDAAIEAKLAPVVEAVAELQNKLSHYPASTWNHRYPAVSGAEGATARVGDMLAHARANSFMTHHQFVPLMQAIESLAPNRQAKADIRALTDRAVNTPAEDDR